MLLLTQMPLHTHKASSVEGGGAFKQKQSAQQNIKASP